MSVQRKFLIIAAQFFLIALFLLWFARSLTEDIRLLDRYWKSHSGQIEKKADAIHQLSQRFGYGGFIHHFKNLVLRLDTDYISRSSDALANTYAAIDHSRSLPITSVETAAMDRIAVTVAEYDDRLQQLKILLGQGLSQTELDALQLGDDEHKSYQAGR